MSAALLDIARTGHAAPLAQALDARLITPPAPLRLADALLRRRAYEDGAAAVPCAVAAIRRLRPSVAHGFSLADAVAALRWGGAPVVLSFTAPVWRENVAARRLRMTYLRTALAGCAAFTAPDEEVAASVDRWLGVRAEVLDPRRDAAGFARLHQTLVNGGTR